MTLEELMGRYNSPGEFVDAFRNMDRRQQDQTWAELIEVAFRDFFNKRQQFYKYGSQIYQKPTQSP